MAITRRCFVGSGMVAASLAALGRDAFPFTLARTQRADLDTLVSPHHHFDTHIVGCKVAGGGECDASQVDFVDVNRTVYEVVDASYEMVQVADDATCADVRAKLP